MVDSRATNSFVHNEVVQQLKATTVDVPTIEFTLTDSSCVNCSTAVTLYLKYVKICNKVPLECLKLYMQVVVSCVMFCPI